MDLQTTMTSIKVYLKEQMQLAADQSQDSLFSIETVIKTSAPDKPGARGLEAKSSRWAGICGSSGPVAIHCSSAKPHVCLQHTGLLLSQWGDRAGPAWV